MDTVGAAIAVTNRTYDLLGTGPTRLGRLLPWDEDWRSGSVYPRYARPVLARRWPVKPGADSGADIKVPWELGRFAHLCTLAQAHVLTGDPRYALESAAQVRDFIERCPPPRGVQWLCTMDIAIRAMAWVWSFPLLRGAAGWDGPFAEQFLRSCQFHGEYIRDHLETTGVVGNHYLADLAGLVFLGLGLPCLPEAGTWVDFALDELSGQVLRQFHPDGTNFEASIPYHRLSTELALYSLALARAQGLAPDPEAWRRIEQAVDFVLHYTRPDGSSPNVGDCDDGRALVLSEQTRRHKSDHRYLLSTGAVLFGRPDFAVASGGLHAETLWLLGPTAAEQFSAVLADWSPARHSVVCSRAFPQSGYFVLRHADDHMFVDAGGNGQEGNGGHGHNDALSFELCVSGVPVIVDPGTYCYTSDTAQRDSFRSSHAHNGIVVDDEEISPIVPGAVFALHDAACPEVTTWFAGPEGAMLVARHRGYERLAAPVGVVREISHTVGDSSWCVVDRLEGTGRRRLKLVFCFAPGVGVTVEQSDGQAVLAVAALRDGGALYVRCSATQCVGDMCAEVDDAWYSPSYGVREQTRRLVVRCDSALPARMETHLTREHPCSSEVPLANSA